MIAPGLAVILSAVLAAAPQVGAGKKARAETPGANTLKYKLLPGAEGKLCLECHAAFVEKTGRKHVHTPVRSGNCVGCHNPHASRHAQLLADGPTAVCQTCHASLVPAGAKSVHKPVASGGCNTCHDPHASDQPAVLLKPALELCGGCHKPVIDAVTRAKIKHAPVQQGCATCHDPHASAKADVLLAKAEPQLCLGCHPGDSPEFARDHQGYPVTRARCSTCHDPHGSDTAGMLRNNVHKPVAQRDCGKCHNAAGDPKALQTRAAGTAVCAGCHKDQIDKMMAKPRIHSVLVAETGCLTCHDPHASAEPNLVAGRGASTCGKCHQDTLARHERSPTRHPPVGDGKCGACHDPHSSETPLLLRQAATIELCGKCHDWQRHSSHPIGPKVKDPRNKNLTVDCLSCHRSHGTEYKHLMPTPSVSDLCVKCHEQFKR